MKLLMLIAALSLLGCGDDAPVSHTVTEYVDRVETVETIKVNAFEGYFECDNGGYLDMLSDDNSVYLERQLLISKNTDGSYGNFPSLSSSKLVLSGNTFRYMENANFSSTTNDIEEDGSNSNITGQHALNVTGELTGSKLVLKLKVYDGKINGNLNDIIVNRTIKCEKL